MALRIRHVGLKIVSVVLALLLWLLVSGEQTVERALRIPLEFTNVPSDLELVGEAPEIVDVRLRGSSGTMSRISAGELAAVLDVRTARAGQRLFHLTPDDVLDPQSYIKLGFTIDGRSGLGTFEKYFLHLVEMLRAGTPISAILDDPAVRKRCELLESENEHFCQELRSHSRVDGNVVVTDFRDLDHTPIGNRFLVYALYPEVNVSARIHWGPERRFPMLLLGHSIFRRTCRTNVGELAARYGGGGHRGAASVPLMSEPDQQIAMIVGELKANG